MNTPQQGAKRRLIYHPDQLTSSEPHVIVPTILRYPPGMGPDGRYEPGRQWPDEDVDWMLSETAYNRTTVRDRVA